MIGFTDGGFGGGGSGDSTSTTTDEQDDEPTLSVTGGVSSGGNLWGSGVIMDDPSSGSGGSTYDPTTGDDSDPLTGTVDAGQSGSEEIDLTTDRGQDVINSPVVDPESDDVTGSGQNPGGVQRVTRLTGDAWNDALENARAGRWGDLVTLVAVALVVVFGAVGAVVGSN